VAGEQGEPSFSQAAQGTLDSVAGPGMSSSRFFKVSGCLRPRTSSRTGAQAGEQISRLRPFPLPNQPGCAGVPEAGNADGFWLTCRNSSSSP
jgi:hypothetical protein